MSIASLDQRVDTCFFICSATASGDTVVAPGHFEASRAYPMSTKKQVVHVVLAIGELKGPAFEMLYLGLLFKATSV